MINENTDSTNQGLVLGNKALVAEVFAKNGFLVLSSATGEEKTSEVSANLRRKKAELLYNLTS